MKATKEKPDLESAKARIGKLAEDVYAKRNIYQEAEVKMCREITALIVARMSFLASQGNMEMHFGQVPNEFNIDFPFGIFRFDKDDVGTYYDVLIYRETDDSLFLARDGKCEINERFRLKDSEKLMSLLIDLEKMGYFNDDRITDFIY